MVTDEEMKVFYQRQKEYDERRMRRREDETEEEYRVRTKGHVALSSTFEEFMGKRGHQAAKKPKPAPAPAPAPTPPPKQSLGSQLLGAGKNWLENAAANTQGRTPPHKAKSAVGKWLSNAAVNINTGRVNMGFNPLGTFTLPSNPAPLPPGWGMGLGPAAPTRSEPRRKKKGKRHREPREELQPWEAGYLPPGVRRFL